MAQVLMIAYYFPPLGGIGSVRASSFGKHLAAFGWEATVLAPFSGAYYRDPGLGFPEERIVRSRSFEVSRAAKRVLRAGGDDTAPARPRGGRRALQTAARRFVYYPDGQIGWYLPSVRAGRRVMRARMFDVILSTAYPVTSHLIARRLHRDTGVPWVAEYRDPFTELIAPGSLTRRRGSRLERSIARESSAIVMTSPSWARAQSERWGRPVTAITNGCDEPLPAAGNRGPEFVLTHLGTLYPSRHDLRAAWLAVRRLLEARTQMVPRICFIGDPDPSVISEVERYGLRSHIYVTGFLPSNEALDRMRYADALLMAGPRDASGILRGWIPAKMFEYLATDLPIIYVGDPRSDAAELLRSHAGCYIHDTRDADGLAASLVASQGCRYRRDTTEFTRLALAERLANLLSDVSGATPRFTAAQS